MFENHSVKSLKPDLSNDTTHLLSHWSIPLKLELRIERVGSCNKNAQIQMATLFAIVGTGFTSHRYSSWHCLPYLSSSFSSLYMAGRGFAYIGRVV
jgi:hypothetical protein